MVDKSQEDLDSDHHINLYEEESTKLDEEAQSNANFLIQDEDDFEISEKLIAKIERRKSTLKENLKATGEFKELNPTMRIN
jgi:hypothetical protein